MKTFKSSDSASSSTSASSSSESESESIVQKSKKLKSAPKSSPKSPKKEISKQNGKKRGRPPKSGEDERSKEKSRPPPPPCKFYPTGQKWAVSPKIEEFLATFEMTPEIRKLLHPRLHPLGAGVSLHSYFHEVQSSSVSLEDFSEVFAKVSIGEWKEGIPMFSISIFHGAGVDIPDPMEYFSTKYPEMAVKVSHNSEIQIWVEDSYFSCL